MVREQCDQREFERFRSLYPLFEFEWVGGKTVNNARATFSPTSSYCFAIEHGRATSGTEAFLDKEHMEKTIEKAFIKAYPDLYIGAHMHRDGVLISVWVNRDNHDAEAIGHIAITSIDLHITLKQWQEESNKAKQEGYFFCSGHIKAEPKSDYGYFHFAGSYCKQWGIEHPDQRKAAQNENYE